MKKEINIAVSPAQAHDLPGLKIIVAEHLSVEISRIDNFIVRRRSIDARNQNIRINLGLEVFIDEPMPLIQKPVFDYPDVSQKPRVLIVGAGPAGLFAALHLIELGFKPVIFERGKSVSDRNGILPPFMGNTLLIRILIMVLEREVPVLSLTENSIPDLKKREMYEEFLKSFTFMAHRTKS